MIYCVLLCISKYSLGYHYELFCELWLISSILLNFHFMKESSGLEKKIKISKTSDLQKEDNNLKSPCWTTWLRGWQNWTLSPTPILLEDCISPGPAARDLCPVHPETAISAKDYSQRPNCLNLPVWLQGTSLKYEASLVSHALSLIFRPTVAPPCLNKGNLSLLRFSSFLHCLVSNYTLHSTR